MEKKRGQLSESDREIEVNEGDGRLKKREETMKIENLSLFECQNPTEVHSPSRERNLNRDD